MGSTVWPIAALLVLCGLFGGFVLGRGKPGLSREVSRATGVLLIIAGLVWPLVAPVRSVEWTPFTIENLRLAQRAGRPILIDVYADWCGPCLEMQYTTFADPEVKRRLEAFSLLQADVTDAEGLTADWMREHYHVNGVPEMIFLSADGTEIKAARLEGFADARDLLRVLDSPVLVEILQNSSPPSNSEE